VIQQILGTTDLGENRAGTKSKIVYEMAQLLRVRVHYTFGEFPG
jgi:hypothetical protein